MKNDLDRLMSERQLDALVIVKEGHEDSVPMNYMTGGAKLGTALLIKRRDQEPTLICGAFEREEAAKSGLDTRTFDDFQHTKIVKESEGDFVKARVTLWSRLLDEFEVSGRVGFYGQSDPGASFMVLSQLSQARPGLEVVGEMGVSLFDAAVRTKDPDELARLRDVGRRTCAVMGETLDFIKRHNVRGEMVVKSDGEALTIGDVKRFVRGRLLAHDLEDPAGMIFAQGRDAGVPHSHGEDDQALRLGHSIVFDLFPRGIGGGYFHDMTRTWCLGYAPDEVQEAYDQVMEAVKLVRNAYKVGEKCVTYQDMVCDLFERYGHATIRGEEPPLEGYVHGLGHGLGLQIHEAPRFSHLVPDALLEVGNVFTCEPGLYYPSKGFGVRIEDSLYVDTDGQVKPITDFPKDLVIAL
jgi:Xaa-Pro aminopeptidase